MVPRESLLAITCSRVNPFLDNINIFHDALPSIRYISLCLSMSTSHRPSQYLLLKTLDHDVLGSDNTRRPIFARNAALLVSSTQPKPSLILGFCDISPRNQMSASFFSRITPTKVPHFLINSITNRTRQLCSLYRIIRSRT